MTSVAVSIPAAHSLERRKNRGIPPLDNGDHLSAVEFMRRFDAMPELKKAELIDGIVYMGSPVRTDQHAEPDSLIQTLVGYYALSTPGVRSATNATVRFGPDDIVQPDALLRLTPEGGGACLLNAKGYLEGPPELVVEIAASTASRDLRQKLSSYRRAGVPEYLVWRTEDDAVDWFTLEEDEYRPLPVSAEGVIHSRVLPGLCLHIPSLLELNGPALIARLNQSLSGAEHAAFVEKLKSR